MHLKLKDLLQSLSVDADGIYGSPLTASHEQVVEMVIFGNPVTERWSEILYSPELHFTVHSKDGCWLVKLDALLSNNAGFFRWIACQHSFHSQKL